MKDYIPVKENLNLLRDPNTNAILNTNKSEYETYIRMKSQKEKELDKIDQLENELSEIKDDLNEIKNLLRSLSNESK
jgi:predicted transcriptional regulator